MIYGIIVIWILCGVLAYGQIMGGVKEEFEPVLGVEKPHVVASLYISLLGPFGLVSACCINREVFKKWWYTPSWQFWTSPPTDERFK